MKEYDYLVSLCVIAYNEEEYLPDLLENLKQQTYPHKKIEIVLVDSNSTDNTKHIMQNFAAENNDFYDILILDNPKKRQASGWNVAIVNSHGELITRIDAHSYIPEDFLSRNVANIRNGEYISGGIRPCINKNAGHWENILLQAENSMFGSSINSSRHSNKKEYVKTMFHSTYRREVFQKAGIFNENLIRTEDNEMHYRIRKCGYNFCYDPQIKSYQYCRNSLKGMIKQKFGNGYWIGMTLGICPKCLSLYHFVPFCFVMGIFATTVLSCLGLYRFALTLWGLYAVFAVLNTILSSVKQPFNPYCFVLPFIFPLLHISYGIGTLMGIVRMLCASKFCSNTLEGCKNE